MVEIDDEAGAVPIRGGDQWTGRLGTALAPGDDQHECVACRGGGAGVGMDDAVVVSAQKAAPVGELRGELLSPVCVVIAGQLGRCAGGGGVGGTAALRVWSKTALPIGPAGGVKVGAGRGGVGAHAVDPVARQQGRRGA